jgi:hypothetical protein
MDLLARTPLHPFLLAAYPVLYLYGANLAEVLPVDVLDPLLWSTSVAALVFGALALALRDRLAAALLTSVLVVTWFFYGHVDLALADLGVGEAPQLAGWALLVALALVAASRAKSILPRVNLAFNVSALVLVALTLGSILPYETGRSAARTQAGPSEDPSLVPATRHPNRDIFYLVFDRYGSDWSIEARFGIQNDLTGWLAEQGFQVVPGARANYRASDLSIAAALNMRYLDHLTEQYGGRTGDRTPAREMLQDHQVGRFLQANGYRYIHLSAWYNPTLNNRIADDVLRYDQATELAQVLHDTSLAPVLERLRGTASAEPPVRERHRGFAEYQFRQIQRANAHPERVFVFAHILLPHPPYVYRSDGSEMLLHEAQTLPEEVLYEEQLGYANARIREIVQALLARPADKQPIIVLQADEGPFLCRNADCIDGRPETYGIRFGIQGAYYLPGLPDGILPSNHSSVNTFRTIFREYFGADLPAIPDRSFDWPDEDRLYDFRDITHLLPLPRGE